MNRQDSRVSVDLDEPPSYEEATVRRPNVQEAVRPIVVPTPSFNAAWDAVSIHKALKSSDKKTITNILCKRSSSQRIEIAEAYEKNFKRNLIKEIKSKVAGNVKKLYIDLLLSVPELYCRHLKKTRNDDFIENVALAVMSSSLDFFEKDGDEHVLIEIMCTKSNGEIRKILATYQQLYGKRLEQGIREYKTGNFKNILKILSAAKRDESETTDLKAANDDAETLKKQFKKTTIEEKPIIELLCAKSYTQIKLIAEQYKKLGGSSLEKAVKRNFSDSVKDALLAIIRMSRCPSEYYARRINKAINNYLLDDRALGRLIITRSEIDLMNIKEEFARVFRKSIKDCLKKEITGSYKLALLTLLGENISLRAQNAP